MRERWKNAIRKKIGAWTIFLACLFVLGLSSSRYLQIADRVLLPFRLVLLATISILVVREWWRGRDEKRGRWHDERKDAGDRFLQRMRHWYYGDSKPR